MPKYTKQNKEGTSTKQNLDLNELGLESLKFKIIFGKEL